MVALAYKHANAEVPSIDSAGIEVWHCLDAVIQKCCAKDADERFRDASDIAVLLEELITNGEMSEIELEALLVRRQLQPVNQRLLQQVLVGLTVLAVAVAAFTFAGDVSQTLSQARAQFYQLSNSSQSVLDVARNVQSKGDFSACEIVCRQELQSSRKLDSSTQAQFRILLTKSELLQGRTGAAGEVLSESLQALAKAHGRGEHVDKDIIDSLQLLDLHVVDRSNKGFVDLSPMAILFSANLSTAQLDALCAALKQIFKNEAAGKALKIEVVVALARLQWEKKQFYESLASLAAAIDLRRSESREAAAVVACWTSYHDEKEPQQLYKCVCETRSGKCAATDIEASNLYLKILHLTERGKEIDERFRNYIGCCAICGYSDNIKPSIWEIVAYKRKLQSSRSVKLSELLLNLSWEEALKLGLDKARDDLCIGGEDAAPAARSLVSVSRIYAESLLRKGESERSALILRHLMESAVWKEVTKAVTDEPEQDWIFLALHHWFFEPVGEPVSNLKQKLGSRLLEPWRAELMRFFETYTTPKTAVWFPYHFAQRYEQWLRACLSYAPKQMNGKREVEFFEKLVSMDSFSEKSKFEISSALCLVLLGAHELGNDSGAVCAAGVRKVFCQHLTAIKNKTAAADFYRMETESQGDYARSMIRAGLPDQAYEELRTFLQSADWKNVLEGPEDGAGGKQTGEVNIEWAFESWFGCTRSSKLSAAGDKLFLNAWKAMVRKNRCSYAWFSGVVHYGRWLKACAAVEPLLVVGRDEVEFLRCVVADTRLSVEAKLGFCLVVRRYLLTGRQLSFVSEVDSFTEDLLNKSRQESGVCSPWGERYVELAQSLAGEGHSEIASSLLFQAIDCVRSYKGPKTSKFFRATENLQNGIADCLTCSANDISHASSEKLLREWQWLMATFSVGDNYLNRAKWLRAIRVHAPQMIDSANEVPKCRSCVADKTVGYLARFAFSSEVFFLAEVQHDFRSAKAVLPMISTVLFEDRRSEKPVIAIHETIVYPEHLVNNGLVQEAMKLSNCLEPEASSSDNLNVVFWQGVWGARVGALAHDFEKCRRSCNLIRKGVTGLTGGAQNDLCDKRVATIQALAASGKRGPAFSVLEKYIDEILAEKPRDLSRKQHRFEQLNRMACEITLEDAAQKRYKETAEDCVLVWYMYTYQFSPTAGYDFWQKGSVVRDCQGKARYATNSYCKNGRKHGG